MKDWIRCVLAASANAALRALVSLTVKKITNPSNQHEHSGGCGNCAPVAADEFARAIAHDIGLGFQRLA